MVYILLTDGFEDIEALEVLDILRRADIPVKTVGVSKNQATSSHNVTVMCDIGIDEVDKTKMDMLILPGGPGHTNYEKSAEVTELIGYANENGKYIAAICAAPGVLGKLGLLDGRKFTCYPGFEKYAPNGTFTGKKAEKDGLIITGKGPGAAAEFGFMITETIKGKEIAETIRSDMQY